MALSRTVAPTTTPVTLAEAKDHLRVDINAQDALITRMINTATEDAEHECGRALMPQTWLLQLDAFPAVIELTRVPVVAITSIVYDDTTGTPQTLSNTLYRLNNADESGIATVKPAFGKTWPATQQQDNAVRVTFTAGYTDAASVPESIKQWILLMVGTLMKNPEAERIERGNLLKFSTADRLLDRFKVYKL